MISYVPAGGQTNFYLFINSIPPTSTNDVSRGVTFTGNAVAVNGSVTNELWNFGSGNSPATQQSANNTPVPVTMSAATVTSTSTTDVTCGVDHPNPSGGAACATSTTPVSTIHVEPAQIERDVDPDAGATDQGYVPISPSVNDKLLIGQKVSLKLVLPAGVTASNIQWTIPGTTFKDYVITSTSATAPTSLAPADLTNQTVSFYWEDAGAKQVSCSFTAFGQTVTLPLTLNVFGPTQTVFQTYLGTTQVDQAVILLNGSVATPNTPNGINWTITNALPLGFDGSKSKIGIIQLVTMSRWFTMRSDATDAQVTATQAVADSGVTIARGSSYKAKRDGTQCLDTQYPIYGIWLNANSGSNTSESDSPDLGYDGWSPTEVSPDDEFVSYLVLLPEGQNSRPIPLNVEKWNWGGAITYTPTDSPPDWVLSGGTQSVESNTAWTTSMSFPTWTDVAAGNNMQYIAK